MPMLSGIKKVMLIGSGPIVIGQAAEFDYAGTQACRVLKQAGLEVVLVNSNPATIMTDRPAADDATSFAADEVYLEPLTAETIRRIFLARVQVGATTVKRERVAKVTGESAGSDGTVKKQPVKKGQKVGRNDPCPCGSGKKYKKCCGMHEDE